jgi:chromosome segregation ATPase
MVAVMQTTPLSHFQKVMPELEKDEIKMKNILLLLLILIGVNGSDLLEQEVNSSSSQVEALKLKLEKKQKLIDELSERLKSISKDYDRLNEAGKKLKDLTESQRNDYFLKSLKLQDRHEAVQVDVQINMKDASKVMQEIAKTAKTDIQPLKEVIEALQNIGSKLVDLFTSLWGNDIKLSK